MGFYVNLEMPKDCPMCPFAYYDMFNTFMGCDITRGKRLAVKNDKDYAESSTRPDWCPLIEVPEPHGRLIDADAMLMRINHEVMEAYMDGVCYGVHPSQEYLYLLGEIIDDAPTIIPAEEEPNVPDP